MTGDEKTIELAEDDRRNSEEVHRGNPFPVIAKKGKPALGRLRISTCPFHPTKDGSLGEIKTEHEKLARNAWRSARWVLNHHPENQFPNFLRCLASPDGPPDSGDQLPVQVESGQRKTVSGVTGVRDGCHPDPGFIEARALLLLPTVDSPVRMHSATFSVFVDVYRFRQEKAEKRFSLESTGLCDTKQTKILNCALLAERA